MIKYIFTFVLALLSSISVWSQNRIEVVYLTANAYCPSVDQIEFETKYVLEYEYKAYKDAGIITESRLNIFDESSQEFVRKWEISTNGIIIILHSNKGAQKIDLIDMAFSNVPSDIPNYRKEFSNTITKAIIDLLKQ